MQASGWAEEGRKDIKGLLTVCVGECRSEGGNINDVAAGRVANSESGALLLLKGGFDADERVVEGGKITVSVTVKYVTVHCKIM